MSKGVKTCPSCNKSFGCRTLICKCGYDFGIKNKKKGNNKSFIKQVEKEKHSQDKPLTTTKGSSTKNQSVNKNRRTKQCPNCKKEWGLKKRTCKCGWEFPGNKVYKEWVIDWTTLVIGDIIKSVTGHGPFWEICNTEEVLEIERMGSYGVFKIIGIEKDGLLAKRIGKNKSGVEFIYMGIDKPGKTGMYMVAHKLQLIQKAKLE